MELYKRYPKLCTVWAFAEVVCFAGVVFGWASLVFVFKEEGFYSNLCYDNNEKISVVLKRDEMLNTSHSEVIYYKDGDIFEKENMAVNSDDYGLLTCEAQNSKLNLWFSIAVSFMYLSFTVIGYLMRRLGTRITRLIFIVIYLSGVLCLAFATPEIPWLILPGLCCVGTGGLVLLGTNLQVADLHPHVRSTIVAVFTGLFDLSSITKQLVRIAYEGRIQRRTSYICIACAFVALVTTSTVFFLPKKSVDVEYIEQLKKRRSSSTYAKTTNGRNSSKLDDCLGEKSADSGDHGNKTDGETAPLHSENPTSGKKVEEATLLSTVLSLTCILHLLWLFVHALRFVTFIGLLNVWLENIYNNNEQKVGDMLAIFSYMTMGALLTALLCGFIYDFCRKRYFYSGAIKRVYLPVIPPMVLVVLYSVGTTVACLISHHLAPYFAFVFFTFFRSALWTVAVAFVGDAMKLNAS